MSSFFFGVRKMLFAWMKWDVFMCGSKWWDLGLRFLPLAKLTHKVGEKGENVCDFLFDFSLCVKFRSGGFILSLRFLGFLNFSLVGKISSRDCSRLFQRNIYIFKNALVLCLMSCRIRFHFCLYFFPFHLIILFHVVCLI